MLSCDTGWILFFIFWEIFTQIWILTIPELWRLFIVFGLKNDSIFLPTECSEGVKPISLVI